MKTLDRPAARIAALLLMLIAAVWGLWELAGGRWGHAAAMLASAGWAALLLFPGRRLPSVLALLLVLGAQVNAAGYVLSLWKEETLFDEAVHSFTGAAVAAAATWLLEHRGTIPPARPWLTFWVMVALALGAGVAWELFEWATGMLGSASDTAIDLAMDAVGGALGALLVINFGAPRR